LELACVPQGLLAWALSLAKLQPQHCGSNNSGQDTNRGQVSSQMQQQHPQEGPERAKQALDMLMLLNSSSSSSRHKQSNRSSCTHWGCHLLLP
jgi:hypothetical protein